METLRLEGKRYALYLKGGKESAEYWGGDEYHPYKYKKYWISGAGKIIDRTCDLVTFFTFATWGAEETSALSLEQYVFSLDANDRRQTKPQFLENRREELIDFICERVLKDTEKLGGEIPHAVFGRLSREIMIRQGFAFDETGQACLPSLQTVNT